MARGKQTCKILKEIRRQIAEANGIEFVTSECRYKGDCLGTCPKCEAEVRYLEQQLRARSIAGKAVALVGISAASIAMLMPISTEAQAQQEPLIGATISNRRTALGAISDLDGHFGLPVCIGDTLKVEYVGYEPQTIVVTENMRTVEITLTPDYNALPGEFVFGGAISVKREENHYLDLNVKDEYGNLMERDKLDISRIWIDEDGEEDYEYLSPEYLDEKHSCRIYWDYDYGLQDEDGKPLKEATLRSEAEGYDDPVTIKVKYPKRNAKKTIKFKHRKQK